MSDLTAMFADGRGSLNGWSEHPIVGCRVGTGSGRLLDTQIQMAEFLGIVLSRKALRLKLGMALLLAAALLTAVGLGLE
jgi:hypothetical protein